MEAISSRIIKSLWAAVVRARRKTVIFGSKHFQCEHCAWALIAIVTQGQQNTLKNKISAASDLTILYLTL